MTRRLLFIILDLCGRIGIARVFSFASRDAWLQNDNKATLRVFRRKHLAFSS